MAMALAGAAVRGVDLDAESVEVVVVDANAVIHSAGDLASMLPAKLRQKALEGKLRLMTLPQVVEEVRDKKSRDALTSNSVLDLVLKEPTEEAQEAVRSFARKTGDVHVLSGVDMSLIALAYDMERELVKSVSHLRTSPLSSMNVENTSSRKNAKYQIVMPGWDPNANHDEEWGSKQEEDAGEASAAQKSRIVYSQVEFGADEEVQVSAAQAPLQVREAGQVGSQSRASAALGPSPSGSEKREEEAIPAGALEGVTTSEGPEEEDGGGWETARKSKNAQRKQKRKFFRKQRMQDEERMEVATTTVAPAQDAAAKISVAATTATAIETDDGGEVEGASEVKSPVVSLTGDFAMQNVLLQMGLQVAGPKDGMLIREAKKFGLRCHACGYSTDNPQSLSNDIFCPKCGNMNTLERCQIVVDSLGQVTFVQMGRKKQMLRGTQYSLPQPQTGRNAKNPILREDNLKIPKGKAKPRVDGFTEATWHHSLEGMTTGRLDDRQANYLEQVKQSTKKNPNARKLTRTNRRR
ncbi:RNA-binding NOB1-like protein [Chloropicon primus]|uniref:PIN domain-containing protein n=2 Tax=Chloropicon primus TaxID=1764295 RepID=A0A5B8MUF2_9CHLO|nr:hypothetical protein A3770_12p65250 [Chloropicon primus]UPR03219.1 RNA-binding NOB1-like protein [Chloropicon primus]|eukprot:QDZ24007.1 hypothetical protein A3770_12p65250 [Chloropicon primus]